MTEEPTWSSALSPRCPSRFHGDCFLSGEGQFWFWPLVDLEGLLIQKHIVLLWGNRFEIESLGEMGDKVYLPQNMLNSGSEARYL